MEAIKNYVTIHSPFVFDEKASPVVIPFGGNDVLPNELCQKIVTKVCSVIVSLLKKYNVDKEVCVAIKDNSFLLFSKYPEEGMTKNLQIAKLVVEAFLADYVLKARLSSLSAPNADEFLRIRPSDVDEIFSLIEYDRERANALIGYFSKDSIFLNEVFPFIFGEGWKQILEECEEESKNGAFSNEYYSGYAGLCEDNSLEDYTCVLSSVLSSDELEEHRELLELYDAGQFYRSSLDSENILDVLRELFIVNSLDHSLLVCGKTFSVKKELNTCLSNIAQDKKPSLEYSFNTDDFFASIRDTKKNKELDISFFELYHSVGNVENRLREWMNSN